jgi:pimeloyl-ACP methyl ester carboxylesterase
MTLRPLLLLASLLIGSLSPALAQAPAEGKACAMVVMHGKWGGPRFLDGFARAMGPACDAKTIEMPWSARRSYDAGYPAALQEISKQVQAFRAQGYRRVLLAGHSFGANAVMAHMAEVGDVDGIIALAPGHSPRYMYESGIDRISVDEARSAVAGGRADEKIKLNDLNQGQRRDFNLPAQVLLSYFDPDGLGHMPATAARFKRAVPFMWVIGTRDPLYPSGEAFAYALALPHPQSSYVVVQADHKDTPEVATSQVLAWVRQVTAP